MFITFEGLDGSGKTTQAQKLYQYIKNNLGKKVILTKEPGGSDLANEIRFLLLSDKYKNMNINSEILLHFAARCDHIHNLILPKLQEGYIVISDRYYHSTIAYQSFAREYNLDIILDLKNKFIQLEPDITFFIDIDVNIAKDRVKLRNKNNIINDINHYDKEGNHFYEKVREGFLFLQKSNPNKIKYINGNQTIDNIFNHIINNIIFIN